MREKETVNVKLSDVARYAGISTSTVSRVMNNHPGISDATRVNVLDALKALGYRSEALDGITPVRDSRMRIDVIICPLAEQKNPMGLDYYGVTMDGIRSAVDSSKVNLKLNILSGNRMEISADTEGILLVGTPTKEIRNQLKAAGKVPFVVLSNNVSNIEDDLVSVDKFSDSIRLCDHLVRQGVRRIGLLVPEIDTIYRDGFRCGMARHKLTISESDIYLTGDTDLASFVAPICRMQEKESLPEVLVVASYSAADFCMEMFRQKGVRVPEDIKIVSFADDGSANNPAYITMRFDTAEMGRLTMERLLGKIEQPNRKNYRIVVPGILYDSVFAET